MLKYLYRTCPKCKDYMGVVVRDPPEPMREIPIDAHCVVWGFKLGWKLVLGKRSSSKLTKLVLFFLVFSIFACPRQSEAEWRLVTRVVDRDTIIVGARERVRLIGVDTPEKGSSLLLTLYQLILNLSCPAVELSLLANPFLHSQISRAH